MEQILNFRLAEEAYALEVSKIQEVVETPLLHYIPGAPACFLGAINFHGRILPVLDLAARLGFGELPKDERCIVLPPSSCPLALAVTSVGRIVPLNEEALLPPPEKGCIRALIQQNETRINLLDPKSLIEGLADFAQKGGGIYGG